MAVATQTADGEVCDHCGASAPPLRCSRCKLAWYCGPEHQWWRVRSLRSTAVNKVSLHLPRAAPPEEQPLLEISKHHQHRDIGLHPRLRCRRLKTKAAPVRSPFASPSATASPGIKAGRPDRMNGGTALVVTGGLLGERRSSPNKAGAAKPSHETAYGPDRASWPTHRATCMPPPPPPPPPEATGEPERPASDAAAAGVVASSPAVDAAVTPAASLLDEMQVWLRAEATFPRNQTQPTPPPQASSAPLRRKFDIGSLSQTAVMDAFCQHMHRHGFALVTLDAARAAPVATGLRSARAFFSGVSDKEKNALRTPSFQGYTTPTPCAEGPSTKDSRQAEKRPRASPMTLPAGRAARAQGIHECFEIKRHSRDPQFRWPSAPAGFQPAMEAMYDALDAVGRTCLDTLQTGLGIREPGAFTKVLDCDDAALASQMRTQALADLRSFGPLAVQQYQSVSPSSQTTLRLLHYDRVNTIGEDQAQGCLPDHCDSSMLTISPWASMSGLDVLPYDARESHARGARPWVHPEAALEEGDCIVFIGDALARMTWNFYPSLLHRPSVALMVRGMAAPGAATRISTPFFLRPRSDALLGAAALRSPVLQAAGCTEDAMAQVLRQQQQQAEPAGEEGGTHQLVRVSGGADTLRPHILLPCLMWHLDNNTGGVRDKWPWKLHTAYYQSMRYSS